MTINKQSMLTAALAVAATTLVATPVGAYEENGKYANHGKTWKTLSEIEKVEPGTIVTIKAKYTSQDTRTDSIARYCELSSVIQVDRDLVCVRAANRVEHESVKN